MNHIFCFSGKIIILPETHKKLGWAKLSGKGIKPIHCIMLHLFHLILHKKGLIFFAEACNYTRLEKKIG
jgi:hypothetical protein